MTSVKYFHSGMPGAPVLTNEASRMINLLTACLVDGFGSGTVDSLVVAGGIATVTRAAGNSFEPDTIALISGATPSGLNGEHRVLTTTATSFTFATTEADGAATGVITQKLAPAGWTRPFTGTNLAAYRNDPVLGTGMYLRVSDPVGTSARVVGYESMTDISTGVGPNPTGAIQSGGWHWPKSTTVGLRAWTLIADSRGVYLWTSPYGNTNWLTVAYAGDFKSIVSPDAYAATVSGGATEPSVSNPGGSDLAYSAANVNATYQVVFRGAGQLGSSLACSRAFLQVYPNASRLSGDNLSTQAYPNPGDNGLYLSRQTLYDGVGYRGYCPGHYCTFQHVLASTANMDKITGVPELSGRTLMALKTAGVIFVDITGPWW